MDDYAKDVKRIFMVKSKQSDILHELNQDLIQLQVSQQERINKHHELDKIITMQRLDIQVSLFTVYLINNISIISLIFNSNFHF